MLGVGAIALGVTGSAAASPGEPAPPAPCGGVVQIADARGDGHHAATDVLSAWFAQGGSGVQGVIEVSQGTFVPDHPDSDVPGAGYALVFSVNGRAWFVRAIASVDGSVAYDYGTWSPSTLFTSVGVTTGSVVHAVGPGTVAIDIPPAIGASAGTRLTSVFALTYDGIIGGEFTWVDRAPGGVVPTDPAFGADYVVGACSGTGATSAGTTAVTMTAPASIRGSRTVTIRGTVAPAAGGISVRVVRTGTRTAASTVKTKADGTFALVVPIGETTSVRAIAGDTGIASTTATVTVRSTIRATIVRVGSGARVTVRIAPALPGRLLLLAVDALVPTATATLKAGAPTATFTARSAAAGNYQVVFVPARGRAERATSNTVVVR